MDDLSSDGPRTEDRSDTGPTDFAGSHRFKPANPRPTEGGTMPLHSARAARILPTDSKLIELRCNDRLLGTVFDEFSKPLMALVQHRLSQWGVWCSERKGVTATKTTHLPKLCCPTNSSFGKSAMCGMKPANGTKIINQISKISPPEATKFEI